MSYFGIPIRNGVPIGLGALAPLGARALNAPSLALNFTSGVLDSRVTFTRASTGTYFDSAGVLQTAAVDAARFDYNPTTLQPNGLLIEEQRTNVLLRSETLATAPWFNANLTSIANNTVDVTSPSGTNTATKIVSAGGAAAVGQGVALTTVVYTASVWLRTLTGTVTTDFIVYLSGTPFTSIGSKTITVTSTWQRFTLTTTAATAASYNFQLNGIAAGTIYAWGAQLEAGDFVTSYISTVAATATRAQDNAIISTITPWYNQIQGTLAVNGSGVSDSNSRYAASFNDATLTEFFGVRTLNNVSSAGIDGGASQWNLVKAYTSNSAFKSALAYAVNDIAFTSGGAAPATDTVATLPTVTQMQIGTGPGLPIWNGTISSIAYYPLRLSDAQLQALTV